MIEKLLIVETNNISLTIQRLFESKRVGWKVCSVQDNLETIQALKENSDEIYIATTKDFNGEKIEADIVELLKLKSYYKVTLKSLTYEDILYSLEHAKSINYQIIQANYLRQYINYELGEEITRIMKFSFKKKGMVIPQELLIDRLLAPSLNLIYINQMDIEEFEPEAYKRVKIWYQKEAIQFQAIDETRYFNEKSDSLVKLREKIRQMKLNPHIVSSYDNKIERYSPPPPLYTATLQSAAYYLFDYSGKKTMKLARDLFDNGYITNPRTDSIEIKQAKYKKILDYLYKNYDENLVLDYKRKYPKRESKNANSEAIQPLNITNEANPDNIVALWTKDNRFKFTSEHKNIYELIWYRTLATQLIDAFKDNSEVKIDAGGTNVRCIANSIIVKDNVKQEGWLSLKGKLLEKSVKVENQEWQLRERLLPTFIEDEQLQVVDVTEIDGVTKAPYRYGEGRFIQLLERLSIGKPGTLDTIVSRLEEFFLVKRIGTLNITPLGKNISRWLIQYAPWFNDYENAKIFEDMLDKLDDGQIADVERFVNIYKNKIKELKEIVEYKENNLPTKAQVLLVKNIASQKNIVIPHSMLKDRYLVESFLNKHKETKESLGMCPACKDGDIVENEKAYSCTNWKRGCKFTLWKASCKKFLEFFKSDINSLEIEEIVLKAIKGEIVKVKNMKSNSSGRTFTGKIAIQKDEKFNTWKLDFIRK